MSDKDCDDKYKLVTKSYTTSTFNNKKRLNTEDFTMMNLTNEYNFYKSILIKLLSRFVDYMEDSNFILFDDEVRPTNEWLSEMFLDSNLTFVPFIDETLKEAYVKNIINGQRVTTYNYSKKSDLDKSDCYDKLKRDLFDLM